MSQGFVNKLPLPLSVLNGGTGATTAPAALSSLGVPNPNVIIGGNFSTNPWQRGTTFAAAPNGTYTADRFWWSQVGSGVVTISKASDAPTVSQASILTNDCIAVTTTTLDSSIASGDTYNLAYSIEGYDFISLAQQPFTLSFWVKSTKTGTFCIGVGNSPGDRSCIMEYTVLATNTWEKKVLTFPASPSGGTWNYTNGVGLVMFFSLAVGTGFQGPSAGSWITTASASRATANQVNAMDSTSNVFKLALIKVELGSAATAYEAEFASDVLRKCQRYYNKSYAQGSNPGAIINNGTTSYVTSSTGYGAGTLLNTTDFPVTMRTTPSVTIYSPNTGSSGFIYNVSAGGDLASFATNINDGRYALQVNNTMNTNNIFLWHYTASCEL